MSFLPSCLLLYGGTLVTRGRPSGNVQKASETLSVRTLEELNPDSYARQFGSGLPSGKPFDETSALTDNLLTTS